MRTFVTILLQFLFITSAYGQTVEYSIHLNSGLFSFGGQSSAGTSAIIERGDNLDGTPGGAYTNNPYGSNNALSYGLSFQVLRVADSNFLLGLQSGFESLRSSVDIVSVYENNNSGLPTPASGSTTFRHSFINVHPRIGYRIPLPNLEIDITAGPEVGFMLDNKEIAEADFNDGRSISAKNERSEEGKDYRLRSSVTIHYNKWGFSAGYSYGLRNYKNGYVGGTNKAYSRFIRFGVLYELF